MTFDNKDYSNLTQSELVRISKYHDCGGPRKAFRNFFICEPENVEEVEAFICSFYNQYNSKIGYRY